jgi:nitroreductase / dihydropteridine reductase
MENQNNTFLGNLEWRRAVKHFGGEAIDVSPIVKAIINAPSSFGMQPYRVVAVRSKSLKEQLRGASYGQAQVTECDTLFVFCARTDLNARAEEFISESGAEGIRGMLTQFLEHIPDATGWAARQAYIALGFALAACAELHLPSCPMEGFTGSEVSRILELPSTLQPVVMLAVGSPAEDDGVWPRFRFAESNLIDERN